MAKTNLSPRQKMINMMYLVLLALLALNVDKHVLKAFHEMEKNFISSALSYDTKNKLQMANFFKMVENDEEKAKPYYESAVEAQAVSKEFTLYIDELKKEIETLYRGRVEASEDEVIGALKTPEQMEKHANIFVVKDKGKRAKELQHKINKTRDKLLSFLEPSSDSLFKDHALYNQVKESNLLNANDPKSSGISKETWASTNLEYQPVGALMATLTQYQNHAKALEADVIRGLMTGVNKGSFIIDNIDAKIVPQSNYVMAGENYTAEVMLVATNSTAQPKIMVNGEFLEDVEMGVGNISIPAIGVGEKTVSGTIEMIDPKTNKPSSYSYEHTYQVFSPVATVSANKMNLLYVDLNNPLSISVPGFSAADIRVTTSSGSSISGGNGLYNIKVDGSQRKVKVTVFAGGKNMGTTEYRVRNVPTPSVQVGGITNFSRGASPPQLCAQNRIMANLGADFAYDLRWNVLSYTVIYDPRNGSPIRKRISGNSIPSDVKSLMCGARAGDRFFIEEIKARDAEYGITRRLNPAIINVR
jgi:gliding motility-associated protein GldM